MMAMQTYGMSILMASLIKIDLQSFPYDKENFTEKDK